MYAQGPTLPLLAPLIPGAGSSSYDNPGAYDIMLGGWGFRLATDQQFPYVLSGEQSTTQRVDNSTEPGEQTLVALPWPKSQSSFHAGAGQLNLEQGTSSFEYQQERIDHYRFDASLGINPWTPGKVTRLPDCLFTAKAMTGITQNCVAVGVDANGKDCMMVGGTGFLYSVVWTSGPDVAPTITTVDLSGTDFGGASHVTVESLDTDGANYYASVKLDTAVSGETAYIVKGALGTTTAPTVLYNCAGAVGIVAWVKARLMAAVGTSIYELSPVATAHSALPAVAYTYPGGKWTWTASSESPSGMLFAGNDGTRSLIISLGLTTTGGTPTLDGGTVVGRFPIGEFVYSLEDLLASFLAVGTNKGIHICTYDTYTGNLKIGPTSVDTPGHPIYSLTSRDRLIYGSYTSQMVDGNTGLVAVDVSMVVDPGGRNAWAPSLRAPTTGDTTHPDVMATAVLPVNDRIVWVTADGVFVEGAGPGTDGDSYFRTSRIRYDTVEQKYFKLGLIRGDFATSDVQVTAQLPNGQAKNLGTFGHTTDDMGEFALTGLSEWLQLEFHLKGADCVFNTYQVKAYPAPKTAELITFTVNCFQNEVDKYNDDVNDVNMPRDRWEAVRAMHAAGEEITLVEFTNTTPVVKKVLIDQLEFRSFTPPSDTSDFGGRITVQLRTTEN